MCTSVVEAKEQLKEREQLYGKTHPMTVRGLVELADVYFVEDNFLEAEQMYWQALEASHLSYGDKSEQTAGILESLAELYELQSLYTPASQLYRLSIDIREEIQGPNHPSTLSVKTNFAGFQRTYSPARSVA